MTALSVVVVHRNRSETLEPVLSSVSREQAAVNSVELLVVDDGSDQTHKAVARSVTRAHSGSFLESSGKGAAGARNLGWRRACGEVVLFLDTDTVCAPGTLAEHLSLHHDSGCSVVIGSIDGYEIERPDVWPLFDPHWSASDAEKLGRPRLRCNSYYIRDWRTRVISTGVLHERPIWPFVYSGHLSVDRCCLCAVGGFDESLKGKGAEDVELGIRLEREGCTFAFSESAVFHLPHARDPLTGLECDEQHMRALLEKYPDLEVEAQFIYHPEDFLRLWSSHLDVLKLFDRYARLSHLPNVDWSAVSTLIGAGHLLLLLWPDHWHSLQDVYRLRTYPDLTRQRTSRSLPLLGCALPLESGVANCVLISPLWRLLPERIVAQVFSEALRVASSVWVMCSTQFQEPIRNAKIERAPLPLDARRMIIPRNLVQFRYDEPAFIADDGQTVILQLLAPEL